MNNLVFGQNYANQYDLLYADKDYEQECNLLETVFQRYLSGPVKTVLDLGCGTGNHAIPLAKRGYHVAGADLSHDMLVQAQRKAQEGLAPAGDGKVNFVQGDLRHLNLGITFDVVLTMFAVLGYQLSNADVLAALRTVRRHLRPGGLFVADVWYGPAVLAIRPSARVKVIPTADGQLIRSASTILDVYKHTAEVTYHIWRLRGRELVNETNESHLMRYFFPQELAMFMTQANLECLDIRVFGDLGLKPDEGSWNVMVMGKAL